MNPSPPNATAPAPDVVTLTDLQYHADGPLFPARLYLFGADGRRFDRRGGIVNAAPHPREVANRAVKVAGLIRALETFGQMRGSVVTPSELLLWPRRAWVDLAALGDVNVPSQTTIDETIAAWREREHTTSTWSDAPLRAYLDRFPGRDMKIIRSHGEWFVTVANIVGRGKSLEQAIGNAMRAVEVIT